MQKKSLSGADLNRNAYVKRADGTYVIPKKLQKDLKISNIGGLDERRVDSKAAEKALLGMGSLQCLAAGKVWQRSLRWRVARQWRDFFSNVQLLRKKETGAKNENSDTSISLCAPARDRQISELRRAARTAFSRVLVGPRGVRDISLAHDKNVLSLLFSLYYKEFELLQCALRCVVEQGKETKNMLYNDLYGEFYERLTIVIKSCEAFFSSLARKLWDSYELAYFSNQVATQSSSHFSEFLKNSGKKIRPLRGGELFTFLSSKQKVNASMEEKKVNALVAVKAIYSCVMNLGDCSRYKAMYKPAQWKDCTNFSASAFRFYEKARLLLPSVGRPHNQIALLNLYGGGKIEGNNEFSEIGDDTNFIAVYHFCFSQCVLQSFQFSSSKKNSLELLLMKNLEKVEENKSNNFFTQYLGCIGEFLFFHNWKNEQLFHSGVQLFHDFLVKMRKRKKSEKISNYEKNGVRAVAMAIYAFHRHRPEIAIISKTNFGEKKEAKLVLQFLIKLLVASLRECASSSALGCNNAASWSSLHILLRWLRSWFGFGKNENLFPPEFQIYLVELLNRFPLEKMYEMKNVEYAEWIGSHYELPEDKELIGFRYIPAPCDCLSEKYKNFDFHNLNENSEIFENSGKKRNYKNSDIRIFRLHGFSEWAIRAGFIRKDLIDNTIVYKAYDGFRNEILPLKTFQKNEISKRKEKQINLKSTKKTSTPSDVQSIWKNVDTAVENYSFKASFPLFVSPTHATNIVNDALVFDFDSMNMNGNYEVSDADLERVVQESLFELNDDEEEKDRGKRKLVDGDEEDDDEEEIVFRGRDHI
eukprot:g2112.t1